MTNQQIVKRLLLLLAMVCQVYPPIELSRYILAVLSSYPDVGVAISMVLAKSQLVAFQAELIAIWFLWLVSWFFIIVAYKLNMGVRK